MIPDVLKLETQLVPLSEEFYFEVGRPILEKQFPFCMDRIAAGVVGEGSDCFGFDDKISMDHDYGPGFEIWLPSDLYQEVGAQMNHVYQSIPKDFKGVKVQLQRQQTADRKGVLDIPTFYKRYIGRGDVPTENMDWLRLPEEYLAVVTNGKVFEDNEGAFTAIRNGLLAYYPEDVRRKKMAAKAVKMAHAGQVNYGRMMSRHDTVAAGMALNEFMRLAISMVYMLNKVYKPYYKWMWRGMENLPKLKRVQTLLREIADMAPDCGNWDPEKWMEYRTAVNRQDPIVDRIEEICALIVQEFRFQGLSRNNSDYLEPHGYEIQGGIADERLKYMNIMAC